MGRVYTARAVVSDAGRTAATQPDEILAPKDIKRVLIVGFYGHGNLGDESFRNGFEALLPDRADLTYRDQVPANANDYDALIFGGGSFLDTPIPSMVMPEDVTIPTAFIGVGVHGVIDPLVARWMDTTRLILPRNGQDAVPDLAFAAEWDFPDVEQAGILVLGCEDVIPDRNYPLWRTAAWQMFASELAAYLDGADVTFMPMCTHPHWARDDRLFPAHIVSLMSDRRHVTILDSGDLLTEIAQSQLVITLRFHGAILAAIADRPFIGVVHHDKLRSFFGENHLPNSVDFYGISSQRLAQVSQPPAGTFPAFRKAAYDTWHGLSGTVADALRL